MTLDQEFAFAIILGTIGLLIWDRIRYDLIALVALLASVASGIVGPDEAFRGFSDDIVIIVGSALVVSAAIGRSGLVETLMKPLVPRMGTSYMQVAVLGSAVTALSVFIKNIGALAIFIPIALQVARRTQKPPSRTPLVRARARPAWMRSWMIERSNSANTPSIWNSARPAGVVVATPCTCK